MPFAHRLTPIIVTHNNAATIEACLKSLAAHGLTNSIIIDNASTDRTVDHLTTAPLLIRNDNNLGFAAAANQGAARATTDYLLFFNPDAELLHSPLPALEYLDGHPQLAAVGLGLEMKPGFLEPFSFGRQEVTPFSIFTRKRFSLPPSQAALPWHVPVAWVSAGALIVRRGAFRQVSGFDPRFFLYWEDVDLARRLRQAGHRLALFPHLTVRHHRGHSLPDTRRKAALYDLAADSYFKKHYPAYIWWPLQTIRRCYRYFSPSSR